MALVMGQTKEKSKLPSPHDILLSSDFSELRFAMSTCATERYTDEALIQTRLFKLEKAKSPL